jgi:hypothetical protein
MRQRRGASGQGEQPPSRPSEALPRIHPAGFNRLSAMKESRAAALRAPFSLYRANPQRLAERLHRHGNFIDPRSVTNVRQPVHLLRVRPARSAGRTR